MYGNASKIAVNATCGKYFSKIGLPHVYIALFRCLWVPGGGLEPFRRVNLQEPRDIEITQCKPRYREHILPVYWPFIKSRFHCMVFNDKLNPEFSKQT